MDIDEGYLVARKKDVTASTLLPPYYLAKVEVKKGIAVVTTSEGFESYVMNFVREVRSEWGDVFPNRTKGFPNNGHDVRFPRAERC